MQSFLKEVFQDAVTCDRRVAVFVGGTKNTRFFDDLGELEDFAQEQAKRHDVYFGLGLVQNGRGGRGTARDIAAIGAVWADIDLFRSFRSQKSLPLSLAEAELLAGEMPLGPSLLVDSGHGLHAYWLLDQPYLITSPEERARAARATKGWHGLLCQKAAAHGWHMENLGDLTRVLRLPGTTNHKIPQMPMDVSILVSHPHRRYSIAEIEGHIPLTADNRVAADLGLTLAAAAEPPADKFASAIAEAPQFLATWEGKRGDLPDQSQSGYDLSLATVAALRGWSDQEVANLIIAARRHSKRNPAKALRKSYMQNTIKAARAACPETTGVDLSGFGIMPPAPPTPPPVPIELLRIPGFVSEVMDHCLAEAPYPNPVLAFAGALSLQAFLAGRKVRDPSDNRTNIYLLGLAYSAVGKDWPRKVNMRIAHHVGLANCVGDGIASGEGLQDALFGRPSMLLQTDELDSLLLAINNAKDARHEYVAQTLLKLFSSANSVFPMRAKAGRITGEVIDQPNLVLFGTAIPTNFYEALSQRMLTNGFLSRMLVLESGPRSPGQESRVGDIPSRILDTAAWWANYRVGHGNMNQLHPTVATVAYSDEARELMGEFRRECEQEYAECERKGDSVGTTVWGRATEHCRKLALLYAVSENHWKAEINAAAATWATRFIKYHSQRMLFMAEGHVSRNAFDAECLRFLGKLRESEGHTLSHSMLLRRMRMDAQSFGRVAQTLAQRNEIEVSSVPTNGRTGTWYRLATLVNQAC